MPHCTCHSKTQAEAEAEEEEEEGGADADDEAGGVNVDSPAPVPSVSLTDMDVEMREAVPSVQAFLGALEDFSWDDLAGSSCTVGGTSQGRAWGNTYDHADLDPPHFEPQLISGYIFTYHHEGNPAHFKPSSSVLPTMKLRHDFESGMTIHKILDTCKQVWPPAGLSGM
jgi:hypothetical protein